METTIQRRLGAIKWRFDQEGIQGPKYPTPPGFVHVSVQVCFDHACKEIMFTILVSFTTHCGKLNLLLQKKIAF